MARKKRKPTVPQKPQVSALEMPMPDDPPPNDPPGNG
jgi:hypothetical protein